MSPTPNQIGEYNTGLSISEIVQTVADALIGRELTSTELSAIQSCIRAKTANVLKPSTTKITPPQLAERWGVSPEKVLTWIHNGELRAINGATSKSTRPRYLIDLDDVVKFEACRVVPTDIKIRVPRKRQRTDVKKFF